MQPLANKFIELLESKQLLSDDVLVELRKHVAESKVKLSPELIAKLLVDNGHLTKFQATKLVAELTAGGSLPTPSTSQSPKSSNEELGFAPATEVAEVVLDGDDQVIDVEEVEEVEVVDVVEVVEVPEPKPSRKSRTDESASSGKSRSTAPLVEVVEASSAAGTSNRISDVPIERVRKVKPAQSSSNPWDSFRILGVSVILALVLVAGFFLVRWVIRGSAEDAIKRADDSYEQRSYETAAGMYKDFASNWPTNEKASYARVRQVLALLRKDVEAGTNPIIGLRTAEQYLPTIAAESNLSEQQSDLTGALISLAEKFTTKMDSVQQTDQRKELMADMDKLMVMINDPKFVGSAQRNQQAPTLLKIDESRARILREINRDDELTAALKEMDQLLEAKDVLKAYAVRSELIAKYPLLEVNEQLVKRVTLASDTQRQLVKDASNSASSFTEKTPADQLKTFTFSHRQGQPIADLEGTVVYCRVKSTVYALNAGTGEVLWHWVVGPGLDSHPIRLEAAPSPDVLVSETSTGRLHRLASENGERRWSLDFAEPILSPVVEKEDIVLTTLSGKVYCLDALGGQTKWVKQLPQPVQVGPCLVAGKRFIYQPADHSNIYVLDRQNGSCTEVYYLGHRAGALKVPLVMNQGILFAFDNINSDSSRIRMLLPSSEGTVTAQDPISIEGNIIATPAIDRTRMLVQSDLGTARVLDIELNNERNKVSVIASIPKNLDKPRLTWSTFNQNFVWLAETRLARFDLVVSQGKLNIKWSDFDGDQFVGPLQLFGKTLIHARRVRGNQGVRVSAINADDRTRHWEVDLAEPVAMIYRKQSQRRYSVMTTSGSYYELANKPIASQADKVAGQNRDNKWFSAPVWLSPTQAAILNRSNSKEFALYNDADSSLRVLAVPFGTASPTCDAIAAEGRLVVGLDNGQLVMFDPNTGAVVGTPYQPALKPNAKVVWNRPVYLAASKSIIVANDSKRIVRLDAREGLRQLSEESREFPLVGPLAVVGDSIAAVQAATGADELLTFNATSLTAGRAVALDSKLVAGPFSGSKVGVLQTEKSLVGFGEDGAIQWSCPFPGSKILGEPDISGDRAIFATRDGQLLQVELTSGVITGKIGLGQSLSTAAIESDGMILVGSDEGAVLVAPVSSLSNPGAPQ